MIVGEWPNTRGDVFLKFPSEEPTRVSREQPSEPDAVLRSLTRLPLLNSCAARREQRPLGMQSAPLTKETRARGKCTIRKCSPRCTTAHSHTNLPPLARAVVHELSESAACLWMGRNLSSSPQPADHSLSVSLGALQSFALCVRC